MMKKCLQKIYYYGYEQLNKAGKRMGLNLNGLDNLEKRLVLAYQEGYNIRKSEEGNGIKAEDFPEIPEEKKIVSISDDCCTFLAKMSDEQIRVLQFLIDEMVMDFKYEIISSEEIKEI